MSGMEVSAPKGQVIFHTVRAHLGLSENNVPLHPMVNDHYPYQMAIIGGYTPFSDIPISRSPNSIGRVRLFKA